MPIASARKAAPALIADNPVSKTPSANEQIAGQRSGETKREIYPAQDAEGLNLGGLARQFNRLSVESVVETSARNSLEGFMPRPAFNPAQRAVAAYVDVATQEHRQELVELLGIDVFA